MGYEDKGGGVGGWMRCNRIRGRWWARVEEELHCRQVVREEFESGCLGEVDVPGRRKTGKEWEEI